AWNYYKNRQEDADGKFQKLRWFKTPPLKVRDFSLYPGTRCNFVHIHIRRYGTAMLYGVMPIPVIPDKGFKIQLPTFMKDNLVLNYEMDDVYKDTVTDLQVPDSSSNAKDMEQATASEEPTIITTHRGLDFDAANNQHIERTSGLTGILNRAEITFAVVIYPHFDHNDITGQVDFMVVTGAVGHEIYMVYDATPANRNIEVQLEVGSRLQVAPAAYSAYFVKNAFNVLIASLDRTGANTLYVNKQNVGSNAAAWTPVNPSGLSISSPANPYDGEVNNIKIIAKVLTQVQVNWLTDYMKSLVE
ncbi:hypothetical protein LCGC14_3113590, partial [marine sediment metagenome]